MHIDIAFIFQLHFSEDFHTLSSSPFVNTLSLYFLFREQAGGGIPTDDEENGASSVSKVYPSLCLVVETYSCRIVLFSQCPIKV